MLDTAGIASCGESLIDRVRVLIAARDKRDADAKAHSALIAEIYGKLETLRAACDEEFNTGGGARELAADAEATIGRLRDDLAKALSSVRVAHDLLDQAQIRGGELSERVAWLVDERHDTNERAQKMAEQNAELMEEAIETSKALRGERTEDHPLHLVMEALRLRRNWQAVTEQNQDAREQIDRAKSELYAALRNPEELHSMPSLWDLAAMAGTRVRAAGGAAAELERIRARLAQVLTGEDRKNATAEALANFAASIVAEHEELADAVKEQADELLGMQELAPPLELLGRITSQAHRWRIRLANVQLRLEAAEAPSPLDGMDLESTEGLRYEAAMVDALAANRDRWIEERDRALERTHEVTAALDGVGAPPGTLTERVHAMERCIRNGAAALEAASKENADAHNVLDKLGVERLDAGRYRDLGERVRTLGDSYEAARKERDELAEEMTKGADPVQVAEALDGLEQSTPRDRFRKLQEAAVAKGEDAERDEELLRRAVWIGLQRFEGVKLREAIAGDVTEAIVEVWYDGRERPREGKHWGGHEAPVMGDGVGQLFGATWHEQTRSDQFLQMVADRAAERIADRLVPDDDTDTDTE